MVEESKNADTVRDALLAVLSGTHGETNNSNEAEDIIA